MSASRPRPSKAIGKGDAIDVAMQDAMDSELSEVSESSESDEGSDWETGKPAKKAPKRPRLSASTSTTPTRKLKPAAPTPTRRGAKLSLLITMPMDILFEIFGRLAPGDLVNASRANKTLRATLLNRNAITIWSISLKMAGAPKCPKDMSEPGWAALLFGGTACQECGTNGIQKIDFGIRRRVCTRCKKHKLTVAKFFKKKFPDLDPKILDLINYTDTGGWSHGHASSSKFYWEDDILAMAETYGTLEKDVYMRITGAKAKLEAFVTKRTKVVEVAYAYACKCDRWLRDRSFEKMEAVEQDKNARADLIQKRFIELGYSEKDISTIRWHKDVNNNREMTDRVWARIQPVLESEIQQARDRRLEQERNKAIEARERVAREVYNEFKKTLTPLKQLGVPDACEIFQTHDFEAIIKQPHNEAVGASDFAAAVQSLPQTISALVEDRKDKLVALIPQSADPGGEGPVALDEGAVEIDPLELATSVFKCTRNGCIGDSPMIAFNGVMNHDCYPKPLAPYHGFGHYYSTVIIRAQHIPRSFMFHEQGSRCVKDMLKLIGWDPSSVTAIALDEANHFFTCSCATGKAMPWRKCVEHFTTANHGGSLSLLPEGSLQAVRDISAAGQRWSCNMCADDRMNKKAVEEHVRKYHSREAPVLNCDYFSPFMWRNLPAPVKIPSSKHTKANGPTSVAKAQVPLKVHGSHGQFKCLKCTGERLFKLQGVIAHLKDKHGINPAFESQHYAK